MLIFFFNNLKYKCQRLKYSVGSPIRLFEVLHLNARNLNILHTLVSLFQVCRHLFSLGVSPPDSQLFNTSSGSIWVGKWLETFVRTDVFHSKSRPPHPPNNSSGSRLVHVGVFQTHREDEMISEWLKKCGGQLRKKLRECNFSWHTLESDVGFVFGCFMSRTSSSEK